MRTSKVELYRLEDRVLFDGSAAGQVANANEAAEVSAEGQNIAGTENLPGETDQSGVLEAISELASAHIPAEAVTVEKSIDGSVYTPALQEYKKLVVVNSSVADTARIVNDLGETCEILQLEAGTDALDTINAYLDAHVGTEYAALHIISHGSDGYITLNGEKISHDTINPADWKAIGEHLTDNADILIYGCDTAGSDEGKALIQRIAALTGADAAASIDTTGANGNWVLEYRTGLIESAALQPAEYNHDLETLTVSVSAESSKDGTGYILTAEVEGGAEGVSYTYSWTLGDDADILGTERTLTVAKDKVGLYKVVVIQTADGAAANDGTARLNVITVNDNTGSTVADDGKTQFHEAVAAANASAVPSFIGFDLGESSCTITLKNPLTLSKSITINGDADGDGKADITVSGGGTTQIFSSIDTKGGQSYAFYDIVFDKAYSSKSGAVMQFAANSATHGTVNVLLDGVTVSNSVSTSGFGGAISSRTAASTGVYNANFIFRDSIFFNNTGGSEGAVMNIGRGGGTLDKVNGSYRNGTVLIERCLFDSNNSTAANGGIVSFYGRSATVTDSTIVNNTVSSSSKTAGGIIHTKQTGLLIANSTLAGNSAAYGIVTGDHYSYLHVVNSVFCGNEVTLAKGTAGGIIASLEKGNPKNGTLLAVNSVFLDNTVSNNMIMNNAAPTNGRMAFNVLYDSACKLNNMNTTEKSNVKLAGGMQDYYADSTLRMAADGSAFTMWDGSAETAASHLASVTDTRMYFTPVAGSVITSGGTQVAVDRSGAASWTTYFNVGGVWKSVTSTNKLNTKVGTELPEAAKNLLITAGIDGTSNCFESSKTTCYAAGNYQSVLWAITLNSNNGTGKTEFLAAKKNDASGQTGAVVANPFAYDGWTFAGFDTGTAVTEEKDIDFVSADNSTVTLTDAALNELRAAGDTLYAVWKKDINVTYARQTAWRFRLRKCIPFTTARLNLL